MDISTLISEWGGISGGIAGAVCFLLILWGMKSLINSALPDKILVVTGRKRVQDGKTFGFSVERGRTYNIPYFQSVSHLDLRVVPINVRVDSVNSANGITVGADATACVCIDADNDAMLYSAVERLTGKSYEQLQDQVSQTLIGNFRGALNKATPLQAIGMAETEEIEGESTAGERAEFRKELLEDIDSDISSFGMKVVSVSLQKIWDTSGYIANLTQKALAKKREQVEIEEASLRALAEQAESDSERKIGIAKSRADEKIIEANQKLEVYRKESEAQINQSRLEADSTIEEAENRGQRDVQEINVDLRELRNRTEVILEESALQKAAEITSQGEEEAARIREGARNQILKQKLELLSISEDAGNAVLFIQQQLPYLFESYKKYASKQKIDSFVIMDNEKGFSGAVNRGPEAFGDFIRCFEDTMGVKIKDFMSLENKEGGS